MLVTLSVSTWKYRLNVKKKKSSSAQVSSLLRACLRADEQITLKNKLELDISSNEEDIGTHWKQMLLKRWKLCRRIGKPPEGSSICLGRVGAEVRRHQQEVWTSLMEKVGSKIWFRKCGNIDNYGSEIARNGKGMPDKIGHGRGISWSNYPEHFNLQIQHIL